MAPWLGWLVCMSLATDPAFVEGQRLYRAFEYEQAIFRFQEIAVRPQLAADDRAEALVWLGLSYAGTGDLEAARRNFKDALTLTPTVALPPNVSPRVKALFDEEKAALPPAVVTEPSPPPAPPPTNTTPTDPAVTEAPAVEAPASAQNADAEPRPLIVPGGVLTALGAVALAGGVVLVVLASASYAEATDPTVFQDDAKASLDRANAEAIAAGVALPLGALLAGGGVAMLAASFLIE